MKTPVEIVDEEKIVAVEVKIERNINIVDDHHHHQSDQGM